MSRPLIELACVADARYLPHTATMLRSAILGTPDAACRVHLVHGGDVGAAGIDRLRGFLGALGAELADYALDASAVAGLPRRHFHVACWYRVFLPEVLRHLDRALYLDSDTIVTDSLRPLWETDLGPQLFGAVVNPRYPFMRDWPRLDLGLAAPTEYLNSGVLLMDLARLRAGGISGQLRDYGASHPDNRYPEQDALAVVCRGRWLALHPRWNVQTTLYDLPAAQLPFAQADVAEALGRPAVIHFIGPFKPWHYVCSHPRRALYHRHREATPWPPQPLEGRSLFGRILRLLPLQWQGRALELRQRARPRPPAS